MPAASKFPKPLKRGPAWLQQAFEARDAFMRAIQPLKGLGTTLVPTPDGTAINAAPGGGAAATRPALQLFDASTEEDGAQVGITFGTVAGLVPSGVGAIGSTSFLVPGVTDSGVIYAEVTISDLETLGIPEAVEFAAAATVPDDTTELIHLTVGYYSVVTGPPVRVTVGSALTGSQALVIVFTSSGVSPYWATV